MFRDVPRDGFWRLIGGAVLGELRHRPEPRAICPPKTIANRPDLPYVQNVTLN